MSPNKFWCLSFCFLLRFCPGFGQAIALPPEAISPVTLSAEDYNLLVKNLRQATLDALTWNTSINERTAEIDKKVSSIDKKESDLNARESDLNERESLTVKKEYDLNEREQSLNKRDSILSESESDSAKNKAEVMTLRSDLLTVSDSLKGAEKQVSRLEFELFIFKGVAVVGSVAGAFGLIYGIVHAD